MASNYWRLALAVSVNAIVMYFIMYVMIASIDHFYVNINRIYMAALMAAPMVVVMLSVMSSMFSSRRANTVIYVRSAKWRRSSSGIDRPDPLHSNLGPSSDEFARAS